MAVAIGVWSLALTPGKEEVFVPQADVRITNAALGDELADASGRTTVKLVYDTLANMDDDDEEEEANEVPAQPTITTILCSLTAGKIEQATTDIVLGEDEKYTFKVVGKNPVYLTGNYIDQTSADRPPYDDESDDSDYDSEGAYDLREVSSDVEMDPAELDDVDSDASRFEEIKGEEPAKSQKRPRDSDATESASAKLSKAEKKQSKKLKAEDGKAVPTGAEVTEEGKKDKKKDKKEKDAAKEKPKAAEKELPGGIKILDSKVGAGPMAKKGNTVSMRYIGKLQNGKVFDKNIKGKPFTFHLGRGEVIKGWDEGIAGMQVGGERKLTLPPAMAYGKRGTDGIPANSTLIFEVKLMEIK